MPGPYTPNATDDTRPTGSDPVGVGAAELRTLKGYIQANLVNTPTVVTGAITLTNGQLGNVIALEGTGAPFIVGLPVVATCQKGLGFIFENQSSTPTAVTISIGAFDKIVREGQLVTSIILQQGDFAVLTSDNGTKWYLGPNSLTLAAAIVAMQQPIGAVVLTATNVNPGTAVSGGGYGYGTWSQISQGRVIVGVGTGTDANAVTQTFAAGNDTVGEYKHTQAATEMPSHHHAVETVNGPGGVSGFQVNVAGNPILFNTTDAGGGVAMNVTQPSFGLYIWQRTA